MMIMSMFTATHRLAETLLWLCLVALRSLAKAKGYKHNAQAAQGDRRP